ncbi:VgrG-related protein [Acidiferrimicrobium sp. IK]|uniref:VgrG-related protein n=1 Tax=Acidiferrimicrobium sp. IK TaxID=2871700 RepID=UPI0021CB97EB|nr:VgrG-related protein [Acidiferrimicrobium sp. IK]MCU4186048.1 VgrG-related protein [Acidiferrimicrobium sp. IK]
MPISLTPTLSVNGSDLGAEWLDALTEVRVESEYQVPARATLRFLERDGISGASFLIDDSSLDLGSPIEIAALAPDSGESVTLFNGEITGITMDMGKDGAAELSFTAHDRSHRLSRTTTVKAFAQSKVSDIVSTMASQAGLTAMVDATTEVFDWILQPDSDLGMLTELARRTGYDWWAEGRKLHFAKPAAGQTVSVTYAESLIAFSVRASGQHPDQVKVQGWDKSQKTPITGSSSTASTAVLSTSPLAKKANDAQAAFGSSAIFTMGLTPASQTEAQSISQAVLDRAVSAAVSVRGTCVDEPSIALGTTVEVSGVPTKVAGKYPVTKVEHVFRAGTPLTTRFSAGDRTSHSLVDTLGTGAARTPAFHHSGLVVGIVTNAQDPDGLGRVKIKIPSLSNDVETWWARVVNVGAGATRGYGYQPEVNDEVLVGFENGDPRQPAILGGLFNGADKPPELKYTSSKKLAERTITSRQGHVFSIVEGDDDPTTAAFLFKLAGDKAKLNLAASGATVEMPQGKPITVKSGTSSIVISDSGDITIASQSGNISLKSEGGNVTIEGVQVKVTAQSELALQGQVKAGMKGAMVAVEADGVAQVKGSLVQIN